MRQNSGLVGRGGHWLQNWINYQVSCVLWTGEQWTHNWYFLLPPYFNMWGGKYLNVARIIFHKICQFSLLAPLRWLSWWSICLTGDGPLVRTPPSLFFCSNIAQLAVCLPDRQYVLNLNLPFSILFGGNYFEPNGRPNYHTIWLRDYINFNWFESSNKSICFNTDIAR